MSGTEKNFIYCNAKGELSANSVYAVSESEWYMQARCLDTDAFKTYRKDRVIEELDDSSLLPERLEYHLKQGSKPDASKPPPKGVLGRRRQSDTLDICFTGFGKAEKAKLTELAEDAGMVVRQSVTVFLNFLCYGPNAGPKKMEKARMQGVIALSASQFEDMIITGEIPE